MIKIVKKSVKKLAKEQPVTLKAIGDLLDKKLEEKLDKKLAPIHTQLGKIETRLDGVESRLDGVESRLDGVESRLDGVETKVTSLQAQQIVMQETLEEHTEMLVYQKETLDNHSNSLDILVNDKKNNEDNILVQTHRADRLEHWAVKVGKKVEIEYA